MSAAIAHPQRGEQVAGTSLALRLLPVPGAGWQAEVALVVSRPAPAEAVDLGYHAIAGKDRLRQGFEECGFTTLLLPRKPAELELPGAAGGWRLELRVDAEPPPLQLGAGDAVVMAVPTLAARSDWPAFVASLEGSGSLWSSRGGFLAFLDRNGPDQAVLVAEEAQRRATARAIRLRVTSEGEDGPVLAALDLPVVDGQPVRFASGEIFQALTGWTVEVAQDARVAEPAFEWFHDGVQGAIVPEPDPDGGLLLRLEFVLRRVRLGDADVLVLAGETAGIAMDRRVVTEPPVKVRVERPVASEVAVRGSYRPDPEGRVVIEREAPRSSGEPVRLRIELAVSSAP